jgi:hypothetical protein
MECNCGGYMAPIYRAGEAQPVLWLCTAGCGAKAQQMALDDCGLDVELKESQPEQK